MRPTSTLDPTAGVTAREIRAHPEASRLIPDPTDPRYGRSAVESGVRTGDQPHIVDPTNPQCGELSD